MAQPPNRRAAGACHAYGPASGLEGEVDEVEDLGGERVAGSGAVDDVLSVDQQPGDEQVAGRPMGGDGAEPGHGQDGGQLHLPQAGEALRHGGDRTVVGEGRLRLGDVELEQVDVIQQTLLPEPPPHLQLPGAEDGVDERVPRKPASRSTISSATTRGCSLPTGTWPSTRECGVASGGTSVRADLAAREDSPRAWPAAGGTRFDRCGARR